MDTLASHNMIKNLKDYLSDHTDVIEEYTVSITEVLEHLIRLSVPERPRK